MRFITYDRNQLISIAQAEQGKAWTQQPLLQLDVNHQIVNLVCTSMRDDTPESFAESGQRRFCRDIVVVGRKPYFLDFYDLIKENGHWKLNLLHRIERKSRDLVDLQYETLNGTVIARGACGTIEMYEVECHFPKNPASFWHHKHRQRVNDDSGKYTYMSHNFGAGIDVAKVHFNKDECVVVVSGKNRGVEIWDSLGMGKEGFAKRHSGKFPPKARVTTIDSRCDYSFMGSCHGVVATASGEFHVYGAHWLGEECSIFTCKLLDVPITSFFIIANGENDAGEEGTIKRVLVTTGNGRIHQYWKAQTMNYCPHHRLSHGLTLDALKGEKPKQGTVVQLIKHRPHWPEASTPQFYVLNDEGNIFSYSDATMKIVAKGPRYQLGMATYSEDDYAVRYSHKIKDSEGKLTKTNTAVGNTVFKAPIEKFKAWKPMATTIKRKCRTCKSITERQSIHDPDSDTDSDNYDVQEDREALDKVSECRHNKMVRNFAKVFEMDLPPCFSESHTQKHTTLEQTDIEKGMSASMRLERFMQRHVKSTSAREELTETVIDMFDKMVEDIIDGGDSDEDEDEEDSNSGHEGKDKCGKHKDCICDNLYDAWVQAFSQVAKKGAAKSKNSESNDSAELPIPRW